MISALFDILSTLYGVAMDVLRLALDYLKVLVWPAAVLTLALIYKRPLVSVLERLRKASGFGVTVEAEARELARDVQLSTLLEAVTEAGPQQQEGALPTGPSGLPRDPVTDPTETKDYRSEAGLGAQDRASSANSDARSDRPRGRWIKVPKHAFPSFSSEIYASTLGSITSEEEVEESRRSRIDRAWVTLTGMAYVIGKFLDMERSDRSIAEVAKRLSEEGLTTIGTWRIAVRLTRLYSQLATDSDPLSATVTTDFVLSAENLRARLQTAWDEMPAGEPPHDPPKEGDDPDTEVPT